MSQMTSIMCLAVAITGIAVIAHECCKKKVSDVHDDNGIYEDEDEDEKDDGVQDNDDKHEDDEDDEDDEEEEDGDDTKED